MIYVQMPTQEKKPALQQTACSMLREFYLQKLKVLSVARSYAYTMRDKIECNVMEREAKEALSLIDAMSPVA